MIGNRKEKIRGRARSRLRGNRRITSGQHTTGYLLLGREDAYDQTDELIRIICRIKDPAHKRLAVKQLECIAAMEEER